MGFRTGAYATIWETKNVNGRVDAKMSTNRKQQDGTYKQDWNGWVRLYGEATKLDGAPARTRIRLGDIDVTNNYDKAKGVTYTNYIMYSYSDVDAQTNQPKQVNRKPAPVVSDDPDAMPF